MNVLSWIIFGLLAGGIAKLILPGKDPGGCLVTIVIGILGALIGGFLSTELLGWGTVTGFNLRSFAIAILGGVVLLLIYGLFLGRRRSCAAPLQHPQHIVELHAGSGTRDQHMVDEVGRFVGGRRCILCPACERQLDGFFTELLEPQVLVRQQARSVALPCLRVARRNGSAPRVFHGGPPRSNHVGECGQRRPSVEAALCTRVTRGSCRLDERKHRVAVAVGVQRDQPLRIAARRALVPQLTAAARPEPHLTLLERALERRTIRMREHQYCTGAGVLHDYGDEAVAAGEVEAIQIGSRQYFHGFQTVPESIERMSRASAAFVATALSPV